MKKKILIISYSNLASDPRVLRQIKNLSGSYEIIEAGREPSGLGNPFEKLKEIKSFHIHYNYFVKKFISLFLILYREIFLLKLVKDYDNYHWDFLKKNVLKALLKYKPDLIIANDIDALPLAIQIKEANQVKVILDAHEFAPLQIENDLVWKKYISPYKYFLCRKYIPKADVCFTVSKGIAEEYQKLSGMKFHLFRNSPLFMAHSPSPVNPQSIQLIHHGAAIKGRNLEIMFEIMEKLDGKFILNFILIPTDKLYYDKLLKRAEKFKNIIFHHPVPTEEIPGFISRFDLGIFILPPVNFNYKHALPNKFFEFIQARLGVIIGPSIEMMPYVEEYQLGLVSQTFNPGEIAEMINTLDYQKITQFKNNSHSAAKNLAIDGELKFFSQTVSRLLA